MTLTPLFAVRMEKSVDAAVLKTLHSGFIGQGGKVDEFEKALGPWVGRSTVLAVNSCTSAIQLALRLSGVDDTSEVITTPVTCTATNEPILAAGAKVVWADVDPWTGLISVDSVRSKITKKTKAVIAVHWGGRACDLDALTELCAVNGLKLIEDAAHALGATYKLRPIGSHGDFVCFSFGPIKHVTCGDGGLLVCKDYKDYERGKLLRWFGIRRPADLTADIREWGYKFHMNDVAATIGLENLKGLELDLKQRRRNADHYTNNNITFHKFKDLEGSAFWFYPFHADDRVSFIKRMAEKGITVGPVHERNDQYFMFRGSACELPGVDAFCRTQVNIPVGPWVDAKKVADAINSFRP